MVREIEFSNQLELLNDDSEYSYGLGEAILSGTLENDGLTLNVSVDKEMPPSGMRQLILFYGDVDFVAQTVNYQYLSDSMASDGQDTTFDLSSILNMPRRTITSTSTVPALVELYTYEANISTDYGNKILSVPYSTTVMPPSKDSTDGIFKLFLIDHSDWHFAPVYMMGDIVANDGELMVSVTNYNIGNNPNIPTGDWTSASIEQLKEFAYGATEHTPLNSIIANALISRYAKYAYILPTILDTSFNPVDDTGSHSMAMTLTMLRDNALLLLQDSKPIEAAYALEQVYRASEIPASLKTSFTL